MGKREKIALIIGGGPAGLSAAYEFLNKTDDVKPIIIEELDCVGGISRTVNKDGNMMDLGGHRLFSKNEEILALWEKFLPTQGVPSIDDKILNRVGTLSKNGPNPDETDNVMLKRKRYSRIYYLRKFFDYPISLSVTTVLNLGIWRTFCAGMSYIKSCFIKIDEKNLQDFMINRFGKVLYLTFFENYTQKVWGRHPKDISKEWGEQRIKGLSLSKAIFNALGSVFKVFKRNEAVETSLIDEYFYPKYGCGQLWDLMAKDIVEKGGEIFYNSKVTGITTEKNEIKSLSVEQDGKKIEISGDYIMSSMPIKDLINGMNFVPQDVKSVAEQLPYRDYMLVALVLKDFKLKNNTDYKTINNLCPDSWIYVQETDVEVGRLMIVNNWSPYLAKDFKNNVLVGMEYFADEGDKRWNMSDEEMIEFGIAELEKIGAIEKTDVEDAFRVRVPKAYPAYFGIYEQFDKVKNYLDSIVNLYCIGRNGQHKYNNMDHSMLSGIEAVNVIKGGLSKEILWSVNTEQDYHEVKQS